MTFNKARWQAACFRYGRMFPAFSVLNTAVSMLLRGSSQ